MQISQTVLGEFDHEMATTRTVLERCPEEKYGWRPHTKSFTMAELATHVASIPGLGIEIMTKDSLDVAPGGVPRQKPETARSRKELLERFDRGVAALRAEITAASNESFHQMWSLLAGGQALFTYPRGTMLRGMVLNHGIHHRGQLTVYLRLNDVPVPPVYGPSADEQPAV